MLSVIETNIKVGEKNTIVIQRGIDEAFMYAAEFLPRTIRATDRGVLLNEAEINNILQEAIRKHPGAPWKCRRIQFLPDNEQGMHKHRQMADQDGNPIGPEESKLLAREIIRALNLHRESERIQGPSEEAWPKIFETNRRANQERNRIRKAERKAQQRAKQGAAPQPERQNPKPGSGKGMLDD